MTFSNSQAASKLLIFLPLNANCWPWRAFQGLAKLPLAFSKFHFCSGMNMQFSCCTLVTHCLLVNWLFVHSPWRLTINLDCQWGWQISNIRLLLPCSQNKRNHFAPNRKKSILHIWKPHMQNSTENSMLTPTLMNVSAPVGSLLSSNYRRCLCLKETCQIVSVMCMCVDCLTQF